MWLTKAVFVLGENHFQKCFSGNEAIWLVWKTLFSGNWNPLIEKKKSLWPRKSFYTSIFPSKYFRKMRERERARARAIAISSPRRSRSRWQTFQSPLIAILPLRDRAVDRNLVTGSRSRSHRIEIAISPLRDRTESRLPLTRSREDRDLAFVRLHQI